MAPSLRICLFADMPAPPKAQGNPAEGGGRGRTSKKGGRHFSEVEGRLLRNGGRRPRLLRRGGETSEKGGAKLLRTPRISILQQ